MEYLRNITIAITIDTNKSTESAAFSLSDSDDTSIPSVVQEALDWIADRYPDDVQEATVSFLEEIQEPS